MQSLTADQAQQLWNAGGFIVLTGLPPGSTVSLDGTSRLTSKFSGYKFLPPCIHLLTWSPASPASPASASASSSSSRAAADVGVLPVRSAIIKAFEKRERLVLSYDPSTESVSPAAPSSAISDDHLRTLDPELAAYDFTQLPLWRRLVGALTPDIIVEVLGAEGRADGLMQVDGEDEMAEMADLRKATSAAETSASVQGVDEEHEGPSSAPSTRIDDMARAQSDKMHFPTFNLQRSWRKGAVGEEVTRCARDKSWLFGEVCRSSQTNPLRLLGHFQLAFLLMLHLSSYSALTVYKRFLALFCRSCDILLNPKTYLSLEPRSTPTIRTWLVKLLDTLAAHLAALPDGVFETELPEMDTYYLGELESLRINIAASLARPAGQGIWKDAEQIRGVMDAWESLRVAARRWGWAVGAPNPTMADVDDEDEEEGEYAPVVVDVDDLVGGGSGTEEGEEAERHEEDEDEGDDGADWEGPDI